MKVKTLKQNLKWAFALLFFISFGNAYAEKCDITVGYTTFASKSGKSGTERYNLSDVKFEGAATQTFTVENGSYSGSGNLTKGNFTVVQNIGSVGGPNAGVLQNENTDGTFLIAPTNNNRFARYKIEGLQLNSDYTVKIRLRSALTKPATANCNDEAAKLYVRLNKKDGSSTSQDFPSSVNQISNGSGCGGGTGTWSTNNGGDFNFLRYDVVFEIQATFNTKFGEDGFTIDFNAEQGPNTVVGIDYIKVTGCVPQTLTATPVDPKQETVGDNLFCEYSEIKLKASNYAEDPTKHKWYKKTLLESSFTEISGETNDEIIVSMPGGVDNAVEYKVVGDWGEESIMLTSRFCCSTVGKTSIVFEEHFDIGTFPTTCSYGAATAKIAPLPEGKGSTKYLYSGDPSALGNGVCDLKEGQYAIATNSNWSYWIEITFPGRRPQQNEHTGTTGSGMLMVNASNESGNNGIFYELELTGLCSGSNYEFSAWYNSIALDNRYCGAGCVGITSEKPSNINFEIYDKSNMSTPIAEGSTGDFGGDAPDAGSFVWRKFSLNFSTPLPSDENTEYILLLRNYRTDGSGNDLLIDDIVVTKCVPDIKITHNGMEITSFEACDNEDRTLEIKNDNLEQLITGNPTGTIYVQWLQSNINSDNQTDWTTIGNPVTVKTFEPAEIDKYYRALISSDYGRAKSGIFPVATNCGNGNDALTYVLHLQQKTDCSEHNLAIAITSDKNKVCLNDELAFSVTLTNANAKIGVEKVEATIVLPANLQYVSSNPAATNNNGTITWQTDNIAIDGTATLTINVKAIDNGTNIKTVAYVSKIGSDTYTVNTATLKKETNIEIHNDAECIKMHNLAISISNDKDVVCLNDELALSVTLTNADAEIEVEKVETTIVLPANLQYVSSNPAATNNGGTITWQTDNIAIDGTATLTINVKAIADGTNIETEAYVSKIGSDTYTSGTLKSKTSVKEIQKPIELTLEANNTYVAPGREVEFTAIPTPDNSAISYEWTNVGDYNANTKQITMPVFVTKTVKVTATLGTCPSVSASATVNVEWANVITPYDPESPNATFAKGIGKNTIFIFNRYGQTVHKGSNGWDGKYNDGKLVEPGTYYYVIEFDNGDVRKAAIEVIK